MAQSKVGTNTLVAILKGGKRRRLLVKKALVSKLYPYFAEPDSLNFDSIILDDGFLEPPYLEVLTFSSSILIGGAIEGLPIREYDAGFEGVVFTSSIKTGGGIVEQVTSDYKAGFEALAFSSTIRTGGVVKVIAIRYNASNHDNEHLMFTSTILTGGTVG